MPEQQQYSGCIYFFLHRSNRELYVYYFAPFVYMAVIGQRAKGTWLLVLLLGKFSVIYWLGGEAAG